MNEKYCCPVCGFTGMESPPVDFNICPCCGTEFGNDDFALSWEQLREDWIKNGAKWFSETIRPRKDWKSYDQLETAGLNFKTTTPTDSSEDTFVVDKFAPQSWAA